jgi:hypothetical protein
VILNYKKTVHSQTFCKLSLFLSLPLCRRSSLLIREGGEGDGQGAKSFDLEEAWPSINHSILPGKQKQAALEHRKFNDDILYSSCLRAIVHELCSDSLLVGKLFSDNDNELQVNS